MPILEAPPIEEKLLTADEFMRLPQKHVELIYGKVVELMPPMFSHGRYALRIGAALETFLSLHPLGLASVEASFRLKSQPDVVRAPDVCFMTHQALENVSQDSYIDGAPTLAVEVISKNDTYEEVEDQVMLYLEAGAEAVWVVNPRRKTVSVYTPDGPTQIYKSGQSVPGGEILPGFSLPVMEIFE